MTAANKDGGIITTDYVPGWTRDIAAISKTNYRYMYQIGLEKNSPSQTRMDISCKIEAKEMLKGGSAREAVEQLRPYEDVTYKNRENATSLELWLYEQIEKSL